MAICVIAGEWERVHALCLFNMSLHCLDILHIPSISRVYEATPHALYTCIHSLMYIREQPTHVQGLLSNYCVGGYQHVLRQPYIHLLDKRPLLHTV